MAEAVLAPSVYSIVGAYTKATNILHQIRESSSSSRSSKSRTVLSGDELRLNNVLAKAPADIQATYLHGIQSCGRVYAAGDSASRNQLTALLMKLNFGLVDNLTSFLRDTSPRRPPLDCNGLSALAEHVQTEVSAVLGRLCHKLGFSERPQHALWLCQRCGSAEHRCCDLFVADAPVHASVTKASRSRQSVHGSAQRARRTSISSSASSVTASTHSRASSRRTNSTEQTTPSMSSSSTTTSPSSAYSAASSTYQQGIDYFNHKHTHSYTLSHSPPAHIDSVATSMSRLSVVPRTSTSRSSGSTTVNDWTSGMDPATARRMEAAAELSGANTCAEEPRRSGLLRKVFGRDGVSA